MTVVKEAQARILHQLSLSQKENSRLAAEIEHLHAELERATRKNRDLESKNRHLEELMSQNMNSLPRLIFQKKFHFLKNFLIIFLFFLKI